MYSRYSRPLHASGTGSIKLIIIIIAVVVLAGGGGAVFFLKGRPAGEPAAEGEENGEANGEDKGEEEPEHIVELGEFLVNMTTTGQLRYLKVEIALSMRGGGLEGGSGGHGGGEKGCELPREELLKVKDIIVEKLSAQKFVTLRAVEGRQQVKAGLKEALQAALPDYQLEKILFVSFVMQ